MAGNIVFLLFCAFLLGILYTVFRSPPNHKMMHVCTVCGSQAVPKVGKPGNPLIGLVLWLCFVVPGLLFSLWRSSSKFLFCYSCGSKNVIPVDTPRGKQLVSGL